MRLAALGALLGASGFVMGGCSVVVGLDRFEEDACGAGRGEGLVDLEIRLRGGSLVARNGERSPWAFAVMRALPDVSGGQAQMLRGVSQGFSPRGRQGEVRLLLRDAVPAGQRLLYVWEDLDGDGEHDVDDGEPAWWTFLCDGRGALDLDTDTMTFSGDVFEAVDAPLGRFALRVRGMGPHVPGTQHVRGAVVQEASGQVVAWFEHPDLTAPDVEFVVPAVLVPDTAYVVEFYADITEDGAFQQPGTLGDHAWRLRGTSDSEGNLELQFDHHGRFDRLAHF